MKFPANFWVRERFVVQKRNEKKRAQICNLYRSSARLHLCDCAFTYVSVLSAFSGLGYRSGDTCFGTCANTIPGTQMPGLARQPSSNAWLWLGNPGSTSCLPTLSARGPTRLRSACPCYSLHATSCTPRLVLAGSFPFFYNPLPPRFPTQTCFILSIKHSKTSLCLLLCFLALCRQS